MRLGAELPSCFLVGSVKREEGRGQKHRCLRWYAGNSDQMFETSLRHSEKASIFFLFPPSGGNGRILPWASIENVDGNCSIQSACRDSAASAVRPAANMLVIPSASLACSSVDGQIGWPDLRAGH